MIMHAAPPSLTFVVWAEVNAALPAKPPGINLNGTVSALAKRLRANAEVLGLAVTPGFTGGTFQRLRVDQVCCSGCTHH